jgi:hypothetical protein
MEECRHNMKLRLKEIYNYNSYDWDATQEPDVSKAIYSQE